MKDLLEESLKEFLKENLEELLKQPKNNIEGVLITNNIFREFMKTILTGISEEIYGRISDDVLRKFSGENS